LAPTQPDQRVSIFGFQSDNSFFEDRSRNILLRVTTKLECLASSAAGIELMRLTNRTAIGFVSLLLLSVSVTAQKESPRNENRRALVQMEHDFAKAAADNGTRAAFLEFLAEDGIIFQPGPVNGKKFWTARQPSKGLLSWEPVFADVSRAGDLGYTTGPWEYRPNGAADKPAAFGQYFTIWKKQSNNSWKAVLDRGVGSEHALAATRVEFPRNDETSNNGSRIDQAAMRQILLKLEAEFSDRSQAMGGAKAFAAYLSDDVRLLRQNVAPIIGHAQALDAIAKQNGVLTWKPAMADVSASGDLAYVYGAFELRNGDTLVERGSYVRVWKKQSDKWRVVIDVMSPDRE
jgi:ketosteroid isomerase-like protein